MTNILNDQPDFYIDLGDTLYSGNASSQSAVNNAYLAYRNSLSLGRIGPSVPIFLAAGNHEDEEGWNLDDTPFSPAVGSIQAREAYYPTPINDGFYSGNTDLLAAINEGTYGDEYREDYYAWEWGDALFVVIDEFQYTMTNPYGSAAGEGSDDPNNADQWIWSLGAQQFNWFKQTLENSNAKYKFVFSHNMLGGISRNIVGVDAGYVRGGAEAAAYLEWDGNNADGDFVDDQTTETLPNAGHLRITVASDHAAVEYVRSNITEVSYTYTVETNSSALGTLGDVNGDDTVNSTDVLIALSCDVGLDTTPFCPMNCGDVNDDGVVNSTHALIILSYDASISVPFPAGGPGCPFSVIPGLGCPP